MASKSVNKDIKKQDKVAAQVIAPNKASFWEIPKWALPLLLIVTAIVYSKAVWNGFTDMDDDFYVVKNYLLQDSSWVGIKLIFTKFYSYNYHPLTTLSNLIDYQLFGLNPIPYHLGNVMLHLLNCFLVYILCIKLSGKQITAIIVATLFALHPLHVESVAWVAERKDVLYAAFYLGALIAYLNYLKNNNKIYNYIIALLLFLCSCLSKSAAVTLPIVLLVFDYYKERKFTLKTLLEKAPFLVFSLIFGIVNILAQQSATVKLTESFGIINRIFLILAGFSSYICQLILPTNLNALHYYPAITNGLIPWLFYASLPFVGIICWLVFKPSKMKKELVFGFLFFLMSISVMLQIVSVGLAYYSERYTYISSLGLFYAVAQHIVTITKETWRKTAIGIFIIVALIFSVQTWQQIEVWHDSETLFTDILDKNGPNPNNYTIYWYRGNFRKLQGDLQGAMQDYNQALTVNPKCVDAYYNRGRLFYMMGNDNAALADYNKTIELNPHSADAFNNRGWIKFENKDTSNARLDFEQAIKINPKYAEAYNNKGWEEYTTGNYVGAVKDFNQAITVQPSFSKPYFNKAVIKADSGNFKGAIADYFALLKYHPTDSIAYFNIGIMNLKLNDTANACKNFKQAGELGNNNAANLYKEICNRKF